ncbi:type II toxin-antitoxin system RelE/ParE family toxin [Candidatus Pacearchaeota archaeon]|nr:type II toxin-antitoxin system RelE/ParE family toxin [Candidatus Pacearchaeota archaeon]
MSFKIVWDEKAYDSLNKLEPPITRRIFKKVEELSENPFSKDIKRLKGSNDFRLRIGDYRVIFAIEQNTLQVLKVGHRKNIYDR